MSSKIILDMLLLIKIFIIVYDDCGVKLTIVFQAKDVEGSTSPQIGDKAR